MIFLRAFRCPLQLQGSPGGARMSRRCQDRANTPQDRPEHSEAIRPMFDRVDAGFEVQSQRIRDTAPAQCEAVSSGFG